MNKNHRLTVFMLRISLLISRLLKTLVFMTSHKSLLKSFLPYPKNKYIYYLQQW